MFIARKILLKNKAVTHFICTSNALKCDNPKKQNVSENIDQNKSKIKEKETKKSLTSESVIDIASDLRIQRRSSGKLRDRNKRTEETPIKVFEKAVEKSAEKVAKQLGGNEKQTTEDLMNYLRSFKVSRGIQENQNYFEEPKEEKNDFRNLNLKSVHLREPLNIFNPNIMNETEAAVKLKIWDDLEAEELKFLSKNPVKNCFEEMIRWTEEGKLWQFPIDNDQGMEKEAEVSFTEHIFMEQYLEPWCPRKGPLRKFMELVLIGLSKNHYYTVEEKKAHIYWFRDYFEEKKKLLQELGAMGSAKEPKEIGVSSLEEKA